MTMPSEHHDHITGSVAGLLALLAILISFVLVAAWFYVY
jgi:hypothetical protein